MLSPIDPAPGSHTPPQAIQKTPGKRGLKIWWFLWVMLLISLSPNAAFARGKSDLEQRGARAKIDRVKIDKAPTIRIFATFLSPSGLPVKPEDLSNTDVYCNGIDINENVEVKAFEDMPDEVLDLAIVFPISLNLPKKVQSSITSTIQEILGQIKEKDRVAVFIDDGRGILSSKLGPASAASKFVGNIEPRAQSSFIFSGLDRALQTLIFDSDPSHKRAIILVTNGLDSTLISPAEVREYIITFYESARAAAGDDPQTGITIYVVMYPDDRDDLAPLFEGLARKTHGSYREARTPNAIVRSIKLTFGEIYGELVLEFVMGDIDDGDSCEFNATFFPLDSDFISTEPFEKITFTKVGMTLFWMIFWIVFAIIMLILFILFIRWLLRRRRQKREEREAIGQEEEDQKAIDDAEEEEEKAAEAAEKEAAAAEEEKANAGKKKEPILLPPKRVQ